MAKPARTNWQSLMTIVGIMILVGTEVFGVAIAGGWAIAGLFELGDTVSYALMALFGALGLYAMLHLWRSSVLVDPV